MNQQVFSGTDFGFRWTEDGWYEYDGEKAALWARNALAKSLKVRGFTPRKFSLGNQLRSFGGIGSGRPHIEIWTKSYGVNW